MITVIVTIVAFIVIFSALVLIHEWGHFTMARRAGIKVEEFGIGLPPRAKALYKDKKGTVYSLNWIPFGGYVRLYGEDSSDPKVLKAKNSFASKSLWQRTMVIVGGVFMNFLLAWFLISVGFTIGMRPFLINQNDLDRGVVAGYIATEDVLYIHEVKSGTPAAYAGLKSGDSIITIDEKQPPPSDQFNAFIKANRAYTFQILRGQEDIIMNVTAGADGKFGFSISSQQIVTQVDELRYPFYRAPLEAIKEVGRLSWLTVVMLGDVVVSLVGKFTVPDGVAGPVGIAKMTHSFVQQGMMALLQFTALISISLGVINIMPFPALDGGRFLFIIFEAITKRRASPGWEATIHGIGFALLMLLILLVTWNDIIQILQ